MANLGIAIPGGNYNLINASSDQYRLNDLPPEIALDEQALNRRQQIANLLLNRGAQPMSQGQMVGRFYVPPSWAQGLSQLGQIAAGAFLTHQNEQERQGLADQQQQMTADAVRRLIEKTQGTPAATVPEGVQGPERPAIPATPESEMAGIMEGSASGIPAVNRMANVLLQQRQERIKQAAAMQQAKDIEDLKAKHATELKGVPSADAAAALAQREKELSTVPAKTWAEINAAASRQQSEIAAANERQDKELGLRKELHLTPSGDALTRISADQALALTEHNRKVDEFNAKMKQEQAQLELERQKFGNTADYQNKKLALDQQALTQKAVLERERFALDKQLHTEPSGSALANVSANVALAQTAHMDRMTQFEQNKKQDEAMLEMKKGQYASDEAYKRDKMAMDERHNQQKLELEREGLEIRKAFQEAQTKKEKMPTDAQGQANLYATRAAKSDEVLNELEGQYSPLALDYKQRVGKTWIFGGALEAGANKMLSDAAQPTIGTRRSPSE